MTTTNFSKFLILDKKNNKEVIIPDGFILDYADDDTDLYCVRNREGSYRVYNCKISIVRR